jgi:hypothetical protein
LPAVLSLLFWFTQDTIDIGPAFLGETPEQFRVLLTIAHVLGEAGCNIIPKGAHEPLLAQNTIWRIPEEMLLWMQINYITRRKRSRRSGRRRNPCVAQHQGRRRWGPRKIESFPAETLWH